MDNNSMYLCEHGDAMYETAVSHDWRQRASRQLLRMQDFPNLPYDFLDMPFTNVYQHEVYLLNGDNLQQAKNDVLAMNPLIAGAGKIVNELSDTQINHVHFMPTARNKYNDGVIDYTNLILSPYTETGKASKFPLSLYFHTSPPRVYIESYNIEELFAEEARYKMRTDIFGEIFYLQSGTIGKSKIIIWHRGTCFGVYCALEKTGEFCVNRITRSSDGAQAVIYKK